MKKRFLAAMMAVLLLCGTMTPALAVEEVPASEEQTESVERAGVVVCPNCDKGTFYTEKTKTGATRVFAGATQYQYQYRVICGTCHYVLRTYYMWEQTISP